MAADLHIHELTSRKFINQFVDKINLLKPDVILLPGDILEGAAETPGLSYFAEKLSQIKSTYGVYAVSGNHEHYGRSSGEISFFDHAGIMMLDDSVIQVDQAFQLAGLADFSRNNERIKQHLADCISDSLPSILLHHRPENFEFTTRANIDIQLSGHTHNGQLWPLNMITNAVYPINWGYEKFNNTHIFVTCGAQGWGPPVRTGSYAEIMSIDVYFTDHM